MTKGIKGAFVFANGKTLDMHHFVKNEESTGSTSLRVGCADRVKKVRFRHKREKGKPLVMMSKGGKRELQPTRKRRRKKGDNPKVFLWGCKGGGKLALSGLCRSGKEKEAPTPLFGGLKDAIM